MKKRVVVVVLILVVILIVSVLTWFMGITGKSISITGKTVNTETTCKDSDGGQDYFVKGSVRIAGRYEYVYVDTCDVANGNLIENWCKIAESGTPLRGWEYKTCENGCEDGACVLGEEDEDVEEILCVEGEVKGGEYCSVEGVFVSQLEKGSICESDFECEDNICMDDKCGKVGFFRKIINWFSRLFD